ncbi:MAG: hypothetical protein M8467_17355 [Anaerolineae bacterium]|nr:hypothetical protein [Anaerolineae bacterium]
MTTQSCPYLAAVDDSSVYFPTPNAANRCYAVSSDEAAHIPLNFQASYCLSGQFVHCSRYRAAQRPQPRQPARRWLVAGGALVALMMFAVCAVLAVVALILGGSRLILLARTTDTPQPTATPSPTWTPTMSVTPTEWVTDTATVTPQPSTPTATVSSVSSAGGDVVSPLATPTLQPTATQPRPTATRPQPTATRRLWPTATRQPTPTRGPTLTPSATLTRAPTATRLVTCRYGDTMTFNPASPAIGQTFVIEVRSLTGYADVSLTGAGSPDFLGVDRSGSYYVWRWEDSFDTAGTYTYSFKIESGAATCVTKSVTVSAPTDTPTPTPTVTPVYEFGLLLIGNDFRSIYTDTQPVTFELNLTNGGNITDSFQVWLDADPPQGWTAQYCIGDSCSDYTVAGMQVTLLQGGSQALYIKVAAPSDAPERHALSVTLWVQSLGDPTKKKSESVTVEVTKPTSTP